MNWKLVSGRRQQSVECRGEIHPAALFVQHFCCINKYFIVNCKWVDFYSFCCVFVPSRVTFWHLTELQRKNFGFRKGAFPFSSPLCVYFWIVGSKFRKEIVKSIVNIWVSKLFFIWTFFLNPSLAEVSCIHFFFYLESWVLQAQQFLSLSCCGFFPINKLHLNITFALFI